MNDLWNVSAIGELLQILVDGHCCIVDEELLSTAANGNTRGRGRGEETISANYLDPFAKISFGPLLPVSGKLLPPFFDLAIINGWWVLKKRTNNVQVINYWFVTHQESARKIEDQLPETSKLLLVFLIFNVKHELQVAFSSHALHCSSVRYLELGSFEWWCILLWHR